MGFACGVVVHHHPFCAPARALLIHARRRSMPMALSLAKSASFSRIVRVLSCSAAGFAGLPLVGLAIIAQACRRIGASKPSV